MRPLVTVLVPAHNAAGYLPAALASVWRQQLADLEVLVVDDGSTDATPAVLAAVGDSRLRVVRQPNTGLVGALNRGIDEARGRYLARLDADDEMVPGRLAAQLRAMSDDSGLLVVGTDYEAYGDASFRVRMPRTDRACRDRLRFASCHCGGSVMIDRDRLVRTGVRFDPAYAHAEDYRMWARLSEHGRLANLPMVGYRYRMHAGQVSVRHVVEQRAAHLAIARDYAARTGRKPLSDADLRAVLWPDPVVTTGARAMGRRMMSIVPPVVRLSCRAPSAEGVRFLGRKVYEAAATAYR